jgi:FkbM family methyltransferase
MNHISAIFQGEQRDATRRAWRGEAIPYFVKHEIGAIEKFLVAKHNIIAIDVGANKGFWSKALLTRFPETVRHIYMIDASFENYTELTNRTDSLLFDQDDFAKLTSMHFAVNSSDVGEVEFYADYEGSPLGSLFPHIVNGENTLGDFGAIGLLTKSDRVPCQTLDNIVATQGIGHIDVLKIDTEGSELNVLKGAEKTISSGKIDVVFFEFGFHQVDARHFFRDFYEFFKKYGYTLYKIDGIHVVGDVSAPRGELLEVTKYSYSFENFSWIWNFVASKI